MEKFIFGRDLLHRFEGNPIVTLEDIPFRCNTVFNGTPIKKDGVYYLLIRVEGQKGYSYFALAKSKNGFHFEVEDTPVMIPAEKGVFAKYEKRGIEDPRITLIDGEYFVMYTAYSEYGARIALAKTEDFHNYERLALVSEPGNKDGILFPEKINDEYVRFDRPIGNNIGSMWISFSKNMFDWGRSALLMSPRPRLWDSYRIGASVPPIKTAKGWLEIYHGVKMTSSGPIYKIGTVMLDLEDPTKIIHRSEEPILSPREDYERIGDVPNVVFACGAVVEDNDTIKVYYGGADTHLCVATMEFSDLVEFASSGVIPD